jgi:hypothetical protein
LIVYSLFCLEDSRPHLLLAVGLRIHTTVLYIFQMSRKRPASSDDEYFVDKNRKEGAKRVKIKQPKINIKETFGGDSNKLLNYLAFESKCKTDRKVLLKMLNSVRGSKHIREDTTMSSLLGCESCLVSTLNKDGRGRAQMMQVFNDGQYVGKGGNSYRPNFRPWAVMAMADSLGIDPMVKITDQDIQNPLNLTRLPDKDAKIKLEWSHRCQEPNCVRPSHGRWETSKQNKARHSCRIASHVRVNGAWIKLCTHSPCCLNPRVIKLGDFVSLPVDV